MRDARLALSGAFRTLDDVDRRILYLRFVEERSRREVASQLDMSQRRRPARRRGTAKLRAEPRDAPRRPRRRGRGARAAGQVVRLEPSPAQPEESGGAGQVTRHHSGRLMPGCRNPPR